MVWHKWHQRRGLIEKLPDQTNRRLPWQMLVEQGLHPHPGPSHSFDDSQGWSQDETDGVDEVGVEPIQMPMDERSDELRRQLEECGCPMVGFSMDQLIRPAARRLDGLAGTFDSLDEEGQPQSAQSLPNQLRAEAPIFVPMTPPRGEGEVDNDT